jgi:hypothetical protein
VVWPREPLTQADAHGDTISFDDRLQNDLAIRV